MTLPILFLADLGLMAGYLCKTAELKTIFDLLPRVKFDVGHLVLILLERKADFNSLAVSEEDTPLHALTRLFVRKGNFSFMSFIKSFDTCNLGFDGMRNL